MGAPDITRRGLLGAAAIAAPAAAFRIALGVGRAASAQATPFRLAAADYHRTKARFEALDHDFARRDPAAYAQEESRFLLSVRRVDATPCADWHEFAEAFEIACDQGDSVPSDELVFKLLDDCRRLAGRA